MQLIGSHLTLARSFLSSCWRTNEVPGTPGAWHFVFWWRWRDLNPRPENWVRDIYERSRRLGSRPVRRGRPRGAGHSRWCLGDRIGVGPPHTDFVTPGPQPAGEGLRRTGPHAVAARFPLPLTRQREQQPKSWHS